jgi:hypothetical protein
VSAVLVVGVGGSHVKVLATGDQQSRRAESGPETLKTSSPDHGLADRSQTAVEAGVPLPCARSHRRSPQSMQRGSTRRTITALPQAAHRNQPLVATPAGQNST